MDSESHSRDLSPAQDRLTDALLAEHARLGDGPDEALVSSILLNTVDAPVEISRFVKPSRPVVSMGDWAKIAAAVVAILSIGTLILMNSNTGDPEISQAKSGNDSRPEQVFHLVVQSDSEKPEVSRENRPAVLVSAKPGSKKVLPVDFHDSTSSQMPEIEMDLADLSPPGNQFGHSIDELPQIDSVRSSFSLASNATTETEGKIIYSGDVVLKHHTFILHADSLVMERSGGSPMLKALNARLNHSSGNYVAEASTVVFDPAREELVANGVNRLLRQGIEEELDSGMATVIFESGNVFVEKAYGSPR